jgi:hypothetical protein
MFTRLRIFAYARYTAILLAKHPTLRSGRAEERPIFSLNLLPEDTPGARFYDPPYASHPQAARMRSYLLSIIFQAPLECGLE